jgi:hypothetical protein
MSLPSAVSSAADRADAIIAPNSAAERNAQHTAATSNMNTILPLPHAEQPSQLLLAYLNTTAARQHYDGAILPFLTLHKELQSAKESLEKFKAACQKQGVDKFSLPQSLKLSITERAKLPTMDGQPDLFKDEFKELQSIEADATKRIVEVLLKAKEKHITSLQSKANALSFKEKATNTYLEFLTQHAREFDEMQGVSSAGLLSQAASASFPSAPSNPSSISLRFPLEEAKLHFQKHITSRVDSTLFDLMAKQKDRLERKKRQHEESIAAKEEILRGASSGDTLTALANKAAQRAIAPVQRDMQRLTVTVQAKKQKVEHAVAATAAPPPPAAFSQPRQQHRQHRFNRRPNQPSSASKPSAYAPPIVPSTPVAAASRRSSPAPATAAATAHSVQHTFRRERRKQESPSEQSEKRGRAEKHHPAPRSTQPLQNPHAPLRSRQNFPKGGDRNKSPAQRTQQQRGANATISQEESGMKNKRGSQRQ